MGAWEYCTNSVEDEDPYQFCMELIFSEAFSDLIAKNHQSIPIYFTQQSIPVANVRIKFKQWRL